MNALRAFEAAARRCSIKAAAEELCVTASAVSQQIKKLEEDLNVELLTRQHQKVVLTQAGSRLRDSLSGAFSQIHQAIDQLDPQQAESTLTIACPPPFAAKFLAPRIGNFLSRHPELQVDFKVSLEKIDYISAGIDIGVRLTSTDEPEMDASEPFWEQKVPLASPAYIESHGLESIHDLERVTLIEKSFGQFMPQATNWDDWYSASGVSRSSRQRTVNFDVHCDQAYDAALSGTGVVLGEVINGSQIINDGLLVSPFGPCIPLGLAFRVVTPRNVASKPEVAVFSDWLTSELQAARGLVDDETRQLKSSLAPTHNHSGAAAGHLAFS
jgi:LysR family glycine cleavage system transcriptional activator